jgi:AraC-like DNA-binding protein
MDLLTDLLQQAGVRRRLLDLRRLAAGTALKFPCDRSIGLHVVTQGRAWLHAPTLPSPVDLEAGDIALMARGCHHVLATGRTLPDDRAIAIAAVWTPPQAMPDAGAGVAGVHASGGAPAAGVAVISGAYQLWNAPLHPFFREMPDWFVLRGPALQETGPLRQAVALLDAEAGRRLPGADTVVHALLDVVFTFALRELAAQRGEGADAGSWSHAIADRQVRAALAAMHEDCATPWTLEGLAARAGLSRTVLAERFRSAMGETPLAYLRTVRMQKAVRLLSETSRTLEQVAREVGYQDAFGFSRAFKRSTGLAPRAFRQRDQRDRADPMRLDAGLRDGFA